MYFNDLEELEDVTDNLIFEDPPPILDDDTCVELVETALHLMEEYMIGNPHVISEPDFHDILLEELIEIFYTQFEHHIIDNDTLEEEMNDILEDAFNIYITTFHPERSISDYFSVKQNEETKLDNNDECCEEKDRIKERIAVLKAKPQPVQRTNEWYEFRQNLITASNAYKAFESQSKINELIYEKCQPMKQVPVEEDTKVINIVNVNTTFHWGQKYEPLSVMIYEEMFNAKVDDFGCIQHEEYKFLGASPDGINVDPNSDRYGRMLEIKNIVNREINGIPKKEYWVQMQLQMEVCDLDECDFLETKFVEYPDHQTFVADIKNDTNNLCISADGKKKGVIIYFHTKEGRPFYLYKPLNIVNENDITKWEEDNLNLYQNEPYNYTYMKFLYWKLDILSCVLVLRNKLWFKNNIGTLENVWSIIEKERVTGYEHRAPVRKAKKEPTVSLNNDKNENKCLLNISKLNSQPNDVIENADKE